MVRKLNYVDNFERWRSEFSFSTTIKVRFSETDMVGHVNNVSAFIYMEQARIEFLEAQGLLTDTLGDEAIVIVADLQCDYHLQMYFNEKIEMYVKVNHIGTTSFDVHYMALNEKNEVTLTGRNRLVYMNPKTGEKKPISDWMKEKLLEG